MMFNTDNITYSNDPFDHWILDNFLDVNDARKLSNQFIDFDNPKTKPKLCKRHVKVM